MKRKIAGAAAVVIAATTLAGCSTQADIAADNLSKAAEQFEVNRRIVFINGITDEYLLEITGLCSVETTDGALGGALEVTCKTGPSEYKKHFLGLSDNVTYLVEQIEGADVSVYTYRVVFRPDQIVPDLETDTGIGS
jgi:predicted small secreted protein